MSSPAADAVVLRGWETDSLARLLIAEWFDFRDDVADRIEWESVPNLDEEGYEAVIDAVVKLGRSLADGLDRGVLDRARGWKRDVPKENQP